MSRRLIFAVAIVRHRERLHGGGADASKVRYRVSVSALAAGLGGGDEVADELGWVHRLARKHPCRGWRG